jgi:hypothetical protein
MENPHYETGSQDLVLISCGESQVLIKKKYFLSGGLKIEDWNGSMFSKQPPHLISSMQADLNEIERFGLVFIELSILGPKTRSLHWGTVQYCSSNLSYSQTDIQYGKQGNLLYWRGFMGSNSNWSKKVRYSSW